MLTCRKYPYVPPCYKSSIPAINTARAKLSATSQPTTEGAYTVSDRECYKITQPRYKWWQLVAFCVVKGEKVIIIQGRVSCASQYD